jgi:plasmid stabilization system protein ParE
MVRINWTFQSKTDLRDIYDYISKDSKLYAKRQVVKIKIRTDILKTQAYSGKVVSEIQDDSIREIPEGNYRIIYRIVNPNQVDILAIHHSSRDLQRRSI